MPYIKEDIRKHMEMMIRDGTMPHAVDAGELNYLFTKIAKMYIELHEESYKTYNDIIGALECCKLELYRRKIAPYENKKIKENGDVY